MPADREPRTGPRVVALSGGVGGAKLARGLSRTTDGSRLTVIANTGDDCVLHGLHVSPDVDTVLYALAGVASRSTGWGIDGDTQHVLDAMRRLGHEPWFHLGDRDLATHLLRTTWLERGERLTDVTARLAAALGVRATVLPMTDAPVPTAIQTSAGASPFQEWFVRNRCEPPAMRVLLDAAEAVAPTVEVLDAVSTASVIVLCPSNPYLSIGPILALRGMRDALRGARATVVAVSPIIGGRALKGPAGRMLADFAGRASSAAVAGLYADFVDVFVVDGSDRGEVAEIERLGMHASVTDTIMTSDAEREQLARHVLGIATPSVADGAGGPTVVGDA